ncbi:MAG: formate--tetrahydrofolate ligase, partial [Clostridiales bacterium]|nr:formate--tetrahydrofolate ligase [Clostridiales bacterium]
DCVVIVATIRALKYNGGMDRADLKQEDLTALKKGLCNLEVHIENMSKFGVPVVVAINRFDTDTDREINIVEECCRRLGSEFALSDVFAKGGEGGIELANKVIAACEKPADFRLLYDVNLPIKDKLAIIAGEIYGADNVNYSVKADKAIKEIERLELDKLPICVAKTQYSLSDDPTKLGRPTGFDINISDVRVQSGAGFIVVMTGDIMTMPGLPKIPSANNIDVDKDGNISGLF